MLHDVLAQYGILGYPLLFVIMIVQVIIPPVPAELIVIGASLIYGVLPTFLIAGTGLYAGSLIVFHFGKRIRAMFPRFWNHDKVDYVVQRIKQHENLLLWVRILPYNPADFISYAAGIVHVEKKKFYVVSAVASYGRVLQLAVLGTYIRDVQTLVLVGTVLLVSAVAGYFLVYWWKNA